MNKIPVCIIIDDPAPFHNASMEFYVKLGEWARDNGVKGKFSVIPVVAGIAAVDGSLGEFPGHTMEERLEWNNMVKTLYEPNWTITAEIITHAMPWDIVNEEPIPVDQQENHYFADLSIDQKIAYMEYAMQKLKNAGFMAGGCTMCWSLPAECNADFGRATLEAISKVYGPQNVMIFNDSRTDPAVVYRDKDGYCAVKVPPVVGDIDTSLYSDDLEANERQIAADADRMITEDGESGMFVDIIRSGKPLICLTHIQSLYTSGWECGFKVYQTAVSRLHKHYADKIQWMKAEEIVELVANQQ